MTIFLYISAVVAAAFALISIQALATKLVANLIFDSKMTFKNALFLTVKVIVVTLIVGILCWVFVGFLVGLHAIVGLVASALAAIGMLCLVAAIYGEGVKDSWEMPVGFWKGMAISFLTNIVLGAIYYGISFLIGGSLILLG